MTDVLLILFLFCLSCGFCSMYFNRGEGEARGRTDSGGELAREMANKAVDDLYNLKDKAADWFASMRS